jgi:hypothetical protein
MEEIHRFIDENWSVGRCGILTRTLLTLLKLTSDDIIAFPLIEHLSEIPSMQIFQDQIKKKIFTEIYVPCPIGLISFV